MENEIGDIPESSDETKHITQNSFQFFSEQKNWNYEEDAMKKYVFLRFENMNLTFCDTNSQFLNLSIWSQSYRFLYTYFSFQKN